MTCLPLSRERWEMSFSIKSSCRFYKIVKSSGSSRDTCLQCSCRIHSCSLKVNHKNIGLVQCWETRPDRCSSHLLFRASSGQEPTTSLSLKGVFTRPSSHNLPSYWSQTSFATNYADFFLPLSYVEKAAKEKWKVLQGRSERHRYKEENSQPDRNVTEKGQIAIHNKN